MILVLSAHTDDCELGAGATLSTMKSEKIGFCFTAHSAFRHVLPEMLNAWDILGIKYLHDWKQDFKHRDFDRQAVLDTLIRLRDTFKPTLVFTHASFDCHQDHKVIYEETVRAFKHCTILGYDFYWNKVKESPVTYQYNQVDSEAVNTKLKALKCYVSQKDRPYFNPEVQRAKMMCNGEERGLMYAEKFEIINMVNYVNNYNSR